MNAITTKPEGLRGTQMMGGLGESIFGSVAERMHALGWSIYPQDPFSRMPGKVDGRMLRPQVEERVHELPLSEKTLRTWCLHCTGANVATVFGPRMPGLFALDIDITDGVLASAVVDIAEEHLGPTKFMRIGRAPKIALFYRISGEPVRSRMIRLADAEGRDSGHAVEVLGPGKSITITGRHHKTGNYISWIGGAMPGLDGPETAPEVDHDQLEAFLAALQAAHPAVRPSALAGDWSAADVGRVRVSRPKREPGAELARDGREEILRDMIWHTTRANAAALIEAEAGAALDGLVRDIAAAIGEAFQEVAVADGRWAPGALRTRAAGDVARLAGKIREGLVAPPRGQGIVAGVDGAPPRVVPQIQLEVGDIEKAVSASESALASSGRGVYQRGDELVQVGTAPLMTASGREISGQRIFPVSVDALLEHVSVAAEFVKWAPSRAKDAAEGDGEYKKVTPPAWVAKHLAARAGRRTLPVLAGVVGAPTLRADGSILEDEGYDATTGLLFDARGVRFPAIVTDPTKVQAEAALEELGTLVRDFPFVSQDDRAIALACLLTACVRRSLRTAPMFAFSAPVAGSGKSKLVDIASVLATGREAGVVAQGSTEEEDEKRLASSLLGGDPVISWDNVERPLGGPLFNQLLTQTTVKPRVLGTSRTPEVPTSALVCSTGNNLILMSDMTRRALLCTLDPGCEQPELREFSWEPVAEAKKNRATYVAAALTVLRAYHVAGCPDQGGAPLGSFTEWSRWVRDALRWLGAGDCLGTMQRARELDPKLDALASLMLQWRQSLGASRVTVRDLIATACEQRPVDGDRYRMEFLRPDFREALLAVAEVGGNVNSRRLAKWLGAHAGRLVDGCKIIRDAAGHGGLQTWRMELSPAAQADFEARLAEWDKDHARAREAISAREATLRTEATIAWGDNDKAEVWLRAGNPKTVVSPLAACETEGGLTMALQALAPIMAARRSRPGLPLKQG